MKSDPYEAGQASDRGERMAAVVATVGVLVSTLASLGEQLRRDFPEVLPPSAPAGLEALRAENQQLKEALEGRSVIERAKGALMVLHGCDEIDAFKILVTTSRRERRKVRAVAADVLQQIAGLPPVAPRPAAPAPRAHVRTGPSG
ncbi:ANTAR domain-containing response regulator [Streptomyces sp. NPDC001843]|uniref:ANTAR domain-containing response regulator n=1 Tax=Streptomyces sp. NPDC001843 TaxID=3364617 RepID=UPI003688CD84